MRAVEAGNGTKEGTNGADWWMKYFADLPEYYITQEELKKLGWTRGKAPAKFAPGKMVSMGIYKNDDNHLPKISGESGLRRISIITAGGEMVIACYGQMTGCCLSPTTTTKRI